MAGPGEVALMHSAIMIKGSIIKGRSIKVRMISAHLGIVRDCVSKGGFVFLMVLKDLGK